MTLLDAHTALVIVDVQRDFCPGGQLAVAGGDEVVPVLARYSERFGKEGLPVVYSRDWHPPDHLSFQRQGGPWPSHCVAGTEGAEFHPDLPVPDDAWIVSKATTLDREAYSALDGTGLGDDLRARGIGRLLVGGLATDYCVRATVLDALKEGFEVGLLVDAIRAVDVRPGDGQRAIEEMERAGAGRLTLEDVDAS